MAAVAAAAAAAVVAAAAAVPGHMAMHDGVRRSAAERAKRRLASGGARGTRGTRGKRAECAHLADLREDGARVADCLDHIARACIALEPDHGRALGDAAERLAEVLCAAHERDAEGALVNVVRLVRRRQHLRLVDAVDVERLEDLGLVEVTDAALGHDRDGARAHHVKDHGGVGRARDAAVGLDVRWDALQRHDRHRARRLGDARLLTVDDVHDHASLLEDSEGALSGRAAVADAVGGWGVPGRRDIEGRHRRRGRRLRAAHVLQEELEPRIVRRDLWVEARRHELVLAHRDDGAAVAELGNGVVGSDARQDLDVVADLGHRWRADEVRLVACARRAARDLHRAERRFGLAPEGVTLDGDVDATKERLRGAIVEVLCQQDEARAHAPRGLALHKVLYGLKQLSVDEAVPDGCALATGKDERVNRCELGGRAHFNALDALVARQRLHVLCEATLDGKHTDLERLGGGRVHGGAAGGDRGGARGRRDRVRLDGSGDEEQAAKHC